MELRSSLRVPGAAARADIGERSEKMNEQYWIEHEKNKNKEIKMTLSIAKNKDEYLKKHRFIWRQLGTTMVKFIATLAFSGCCLLFSVYLLTLIVSHAWGDLKAIYVKKEIQSNSYPYQAIVLGDTGKYFASYPKCYTTEHYLACETDNGIEEIVEEYWEK